MSNGTFIPRIVRRRRARAGRGGRPLRPAGGILLAVAGVALAAGAAILLAPLPVTAPDLTLGVRPEGARFYDRTGRLLAEAGSARRQDSRWYGLESAPARDCVLPAFLAVRGISERDLRSPGPLDVPRSMAGAVLGAGEDLAGEAAASLLAMRGRGGSAWEKMLTAGAVAARYDRMHIAEWILNTTLFGAGTVGIDDAALTYFDSHAGELTPGRCAALEALAADPGLSRNPAGWKTARDAILVRMFNGGFLTRGEWENATAEPVRASESGGADDDPIFGGRLPILVSFLRLAAERVESRYAAAELPRSGIRIFTTLDADFELQLVCGAQNLLSPPADSSAALPTLEGGPCDLAALLGPALQDSPPADLALAVIDPGSGDVLAYFDSARGEQPADRGPAGAAVLPFVYLSAFTRGFSPATMLLDIPAADAADDGREYLGPLSARSALQRRAMAASAGLADSVGMDHIGRTLALLGLAPEDGAERSFEDRRNAEAALLPLTRAYATLAAGGLEQSDLGGGAATVLRVEDSDGSVLDEYGRRSARRVFGSDLAYLLQDILAEKTGPAGSAAPALAASRSAVAAMTGDDGGGGWAFAFLPGVSVGVRSRTASAGGSLPAWTLAQAAAGWALRGLPVQTWQEPPGIVRLEVCVPSGLLPSRYCPNVSSDIFLSGNEPSQVDSYYRPVAVDRESGRLATLWTPLALVEEKVFFLLEGEARAWAGQSGFPLPPDAYDTLPDSFPYDPDLHISGPSALSVVRGTIILRGTASAAGMERFLVRAGPGLYPSEWYELGSGNDPVNEGTLAVWDTPASGGVWSIRLTAVFAGGKIRTVAIPVTVDNSPPLVRWIVPDAPRPMAIPEGEEFILQVDAADNLEIESVVFFLDGTAKTRLEIGPFSVRWTGLVPGSHMVKVCARDRSGNETCTQELEVEIGLKTSGGLTYNTPGKVQT
jgi:hypothetical protein